MAVNGGVPFDPLTNGRQALLAERVAAGDRDAEEELALLFQPRILLMMTARTHDRDLARDLTQEVLLAAVVSLRNGHLREPERLAAFVYGIARNVTNNRFRTAGAAPTHVALDPDAHAGLPPDPVERAERQALVKSALRVLSALDRRIVMLTLVDGLKPAEIAERLCLGVEVVRMRKSRAVKRVAGELQRLLRMSGGRYYPDRATADDV